jgi:hypothetical protein
MILMSQNNIEKEKNGLTDEVAKFLQDSGAINAWRVRE